MTGSRTLKALEYLRGAGTDLGQALDDGHSPRWPFSIERNVKGELHLHLHVRRTFVPIEGKVVACEYCAILKCRVTGEHIVADDEFGGLLLPGPVPGRGGGADHHELAMLVNAFKL